jgi:hypothetical protein
MTMTITTTTITIRRSGVQIDFDGIEEGKVEEGKERGSMGDAEPVDYYL